MKNNIKGKKICIYISLLIVLSLCFSRQAGAQQKQRLISKPPIDTSVLNRSGNDYWLHFAYYLSPYGRYVGTYTFGIKVDQGKRTLMLKSNNGLWQKGYDMSKGGSPVCGFSDDEQYAFFQIADSLHLAPLGKSEQDRTIAIRSFTSSAHFNAAKWIAWQEKGDLGDLVLLNLLTGQEERLGKVSGYQFDSHGNGLLLQVRRENNAGIELQYVNLNTDKRTTVWTGNTSDQLGEYIFDEQGTQLAFKVTEKNGDKQRNSFWSYHFGNEPAKMLVREGDGPIATGQSITGRLQVSKNGKWFFFSLQSPFKPKPVLPKPGPDVVKVDVWSYNDIILQYDQPTEEASAAKVLTAVIGSDGDHFQILNDKENRLWSAPESVTGDAVVITRPDSIDKNVLGGAFARPKSYFIKSLIDQREMLLVKDWTLNMDARFSPDGKWVIWFDSYNGAYYSYELATGNIRDITKSLSSRLRGPDEGEVRAFLPAGPIGGWFEGKEYRILLYDNYDIWAIDPAVKEKPINITHDFGIAHHIRLRLCNDENPIVYSMGDTLLFTAYNTKNGYMGFLRQVLGAWDSQELLTMGPYCYGDDLSGYRALIKAVHANCWLATRQSASKAPNYFISNDLKSYRQLTDVEPMVAYNWMTEKLVNFRQLDGTASQGILFRPENFDPKKKYPVIFFYYEKHVNDFLHLFQWPDWSDGRLNIPWFVSHGYIVFTPDIHYKVAAVSNKTYGEYAYNSVVAAAQYLSKLPYIDGKRMGLQGFSFGGSQTNYLVTHSHLFAAAASSSGGTDLVNQYLTTSSAYGVATTFNEQSFAESGQLRMGATLWQRPDLYLKSSPVLYADQVTTPLLLMQNKKDTGVPWSQGVEFYMALRCLHKPSWMLQYDEGTHGLQAMRDEVDYTLRMTQFFDHYLKGAPPPVWMTRGIPARMKGLETGYELDPGGSCSSDCPVCKKKDYGVYNNSLKNN